MRYSANYHHWKDGLQSFNCTQIDALFLDLARAFVKMLHQRHLRKLEYYGIRNNNLQRIGSFPTNRKQCVNVEGVSSNEVPVNSGVPHGTVLGPLLCIIFINDMRERIASPHKMFADDCLVYRTIHSTNDVIKLQEDHDQPALWVNVWQLTLNPYKFSMLHVSNKCNSVSREYTINDFPLNWVSGVKYLGASISSKM